MKYIFTCLLIIFFFFTVNNTTANSSVELAIKKLKSEKKILSVTKQDNDFWVIGLKDDGSKMYGFSQYVCDLLKDQNLVSETTYVRAVNYFAITDKINPKSYEEANLGTVHCSDYKFIP